MRRWLLFFITMAALMVAQIGFFESQVIESEKINQSRQAVYSLAVLSCITEMDNAFLHHIIRPRRGDVGRFQKHHNLCQDWIDLAGRSTEDNERSWKIGELGLYYNEYYQTAIEMIELEIRLLTIENRIAFGESDPSLIQEGLKIEETIGDLFQESREFMRQMRYYSMPEALSYGYSEQ